MTVEESVALLCCIALTVFAAIGIAAGMVALFNRFLRAALPIVPDEIQHREKKRTDYDIDIYAGIHLVDYIAWARKDTRGQPGPWKIAAGANDADRARELARQAYGEADYDLIVMRNGEVEP